jgi:hypothetical protein
LVVVFVSVVVFCAGWAGVTTVVEGAGAGVVTTVDVSGVEVDVVLFVLVVVELSSSAQAGLAPARRAHNASVCSNGFFITRS